MGKLPPRKPPAQRAFTGLVGAPFDPEDRPAEPALPTVVSTAPPKRVGRPAKYADAARKQAAYRARQTEKVEDKERRDLVAKILKIYKRMQPDIVEKKVSAERVKKLRAAAKLQLRKTGDELLLLPLARVREALRVLEETPDSSGRLHNERSGEGNRLSGMSEVERILGAQDRDEEVGGRRVGPEGRGSGTFDENDENADTADNSGSNGSSTRSGYQRITPEYTKYLNRKEEIMSEMVNLYVISKEWKGEQKLFCKLCGVHIRERSDALQHFWVKYEEGWNLWARYEKFKEDGIPGFLVWEAKRRYLDCAHLTVFWRHDKEKAKEERREAREERQ